jgi:hypothetical protein
MNFYSLIASFLIKKKIMPKTPTNQGVRQDRRLENAPIAQRSRPRFGKNFKQKMRAAIKKKFDAKLSE